MSLSQVVARFLINLRAPERGASAGEASVGMYWP